MRNKGTIRFVNQGFSGRGRTIEIRVINFDFRRFPVTYAVGMLYFVSSFKLATKIGFWYVAMASRILPLSLPPSLSLSSFFFLFSIHSVTDISRVSESRKRDLYRSLRKKDSQGSFRSDCHADPSLKSGHREKPKSNRIMESRVFIL